MKNRNIQRGQIQMIQQKHPRENMQQRLNGKYESKEYEKTIIIKHTKLNIRVLGEGADEKEAWQTTMGTLHIYR